jgi:hypothetical protein
MAIFFGFIFGLVALIVVICIAVAIGPLWVLVCLAVLGLIALANRE